MTAGPLGTIAPERRQALAFSMVAVDALVVVLLVANRAF
jgi:hypothetical protein